MPNYHPDSPISRSACEMLTRTHNWRSADAESRQTSPHSHGQEQLFCVDSGLGILEVGASRWTLSPGQVAWIPSGITHSLHAAGRMSCSSIYLDQRNHGNALSKPVVFERTGLLREVVCRLIESTQSRQTANADANLHNVLWDELAQAKTSCLPLQFPRDPKLKAIMQQVVREPGKKFSVVELSGRAAMSERTFLRRFQAETGLPISRWQQQLRVLIALQRLNDGHSVTSTAFHVGFENVSAFIRMFSRFTGQTPTGYLKSRSSRASMLPQACRDGILDLKMV